MNTDTNENSKLIEQKLDRIEQKIATRLLDISKLPLRKFVVAFIGLYIVLFPILLTILFGVLNIIEHKEWRLQQLYISMLKDSLVFGFIIVFLLKVLPEIAKERGKVMRTVKSLFGEKKSFRELMNDFERTSDSRRKAAILQQASRVAETNAEKAEVIVSRNSLRSRYTF